MLDKEILVVVNIGLSLTDANACQDIELIYSLSVFCREFEHVSILS
ncbi:MAG: hypothetical protein H7Y04_00460 [Verrucomicrobia bacterium]|nr:hypothetical protein [Cytophagales bacterium]